MSSKAVLLFLLVVVPTASAVDCSGPGCYTLQLIELWKKFRNDRKFNSKKLWDRMDVAYKRWSNTDFDLWEVSDTFWQKFVEFAIQGGNADDVWASTTGPFIEYDPTPMVRANDLSMFPSVAPEAVGVIVVEPCNTVSNIAFMRAGVDLSEIEQGRKLSLNPEIILGLVRGMLFAGPASMLMHASGTNVGGVVDNESIHQVAINAHQGLLQSIPYNPILHDLRETPALYSGPGVANETMRIILEEPMGEWGNLFNALNTTKYESSFMAMLTAGFNLVLPKRIAERFVRLFAGLLLSGDSLDFIFDRYTPVLLKAYEDNNVKVGFVKRLRLFSAFIGMATKVIYAFLWQEEIIPLKILRRRTVNFLGAVNIRKINKIANSLTGFKRHKTDPGLQKSRRVYPGDRQCNRRQSHSKWHEVIANGLVDVMLLSDMFNKVISGRRIGLAFENNELAQCYETNEAFAGFEWVSISSQVSRIFEDCFLDFVDTFPDVDVGVLLGCSITNVIRTGNEEQVGESSTQLSESLDSCLVENDCIGFNGVDFDVDRLKQCTGISLNSTQQPQPCSSFVDKPKLAMCMIPCGSTTSCAISCLEKHAQVSSWVLQSVSCLNMMASSVSRNDPNLAKLCLEESTYVQQSESSSSPFQSNIARGLSGLAFASVNACAESFDVFATDTRTVASCTNECMREAAVEQDADPSSIPAGSWSPTLICSYECFLLSLDTKIA